MKVFFDTEFTGLHQFTTLISIGMIDEEGREFYMELLDYKKSQVDSWIQNNVISNLEYEVPILIREGRNIYGAGTFKTCAKEVKLFLSIYDHVEMWSDCYAYDWMLFNEFFKGARNIPPHISYIPMDLSTLFWAKGIDPDISREEFVGTPSKGKHNALHDAKTIKACYDQLVSSRPQT